MGVAYPTTSNKIARTPLTLYTSSDVFLAKFLKREIYLFGRALIRHWSALKHRRSVQ